MTTVLALRALGLGDALTGIPALRGLRRAHPGARLVLAAPVAIGGLLQSYGIVDDVLDATGLAPLPWIGPPPTVGVNLHGRGPQSHRLLQALCPERLLAFASAEARHLAGPPWPLEAHEVDRWCALVRSAGGHCTAEDLRLPRGTPGTHVVVHPGAASGSRRWPVERWAAVAAQCASLGHHVVVTGIASESRLCAQVAAAHPGIEDASAGHTLPELAALVGSAALVLCGDTGIAHLATSFATPSVLLFGPVSPAHWGPHIDPERHTVLWHPEAGDPVGDPHADAVDPRLARITVDEVVAAATVQLDRLSSPPARPS